MKRFIHVLTVVVYLLSLVAINTGAVQAAETKATTKVKHKQAKYFVPEHRIIINAEVSDPNGVNLVRCYFKASAQADYVFVGMQSSSGGDYQGILPAPSKSTQSIEYMFLVLNNKKQVVKTQKFTVAKKDSKDVPSWQNVGSQGNIRVSTEIPKPSGTLSGFSDSIAIDIVESSARFGLVAGGVYAAVNVASAGGAAAAATSAGTVSASTGLSTSTIAGIGAGVAAVGAIALSGGSDDPYCSKYNCISPEPCIEGCGRAVPKCGGDRDASGSNTNFSDDFEMIKTSGTFKFTYNTIRDPDEIIIYYPAKSNNILWRTKKSDGTNGPESTYTIKTVSVPYSGTSTKITVEVRPEQFPNSVTEWSFSVGCP